MRSESPDNSATFWWWRVPNDAFRTGLKSDLEAVLPVLSKHCFVWKRGWQGWHHAAEIAELHAAVPKDRRMPPITPKKIEGLTEPPPLPALYAELCKTETIIEDEPTRRNYALPLPRAIQKIVDRDATAKYASVGLDPLALYKRAAARDRRRTLQRRAQEGMAFLRRALDWLERRRWQLSRALPRGRFFARAAVIASLSTVLLCSTAVIARGLAQAYPHARASVFVTVAGPGETWVYGPSIYFDGELICRSAPCRIDTGPGLHFIRVSAPGFVESADRAIQAQGQQVVRFALVRNSATKL